MPHAEVQLQVVQQAFVALKEKRRALAGRTGCGVCGIESIDLLDLEPERVPDTGFLQRLAPDAIARAARPGQTWSRPSSSVLSMRDLRSAARYADWRARLPSLAASSRSPEAALSLSVA